MSDYYKNKYKHTWGIAKQRQDFSIAWTKHFLPEEIEAVVTASCIGKGADSIEWVEDNETEVGTPDYVWKSKETQERYCLVEVTHFRRDYPDCWVRPDKITFIQNNPEIPCWVFSVDETKKPTKVKLIKPEIDKKYQAENTFINEDMVKFYDRDPEVKSPNEFLDFLETKARHKK